MSRYVDVQWGEMRPGHVHDLVEVGAELVPVPNQGALANESGTSVAGLITEIDKNRQAGLSSAVRIFVLQTLKQKAAACRTVSGVTD